MSPPAPTTTPWAPVSQAPQRNSMRGGAVFGVVLIVLGVLGFVLESNNHSVCQSVLVQAASSHQCAVDDTIWGGGIASAAVGALLVLVGEVRRRQ
jgi:hypothetical protein